MNIVIHLTGNFVLSLALMYFEDSVDRIESEIARYVTAQFEGDRSCQELARQFATFSPILFRSKIRTAVREYQAMVLNFLKNKVLALESDAVPETRITGTSDWIWTCSLSFLTV